MGVMSCSRPGCENIMCDTCIPKIGYVCFDCQKEFKNYLESQNKTELTETQITNELKEFMHTTKGQFEPGPKIQVTEFFNKFNG